MLEPLAAASAPSKPFCSESSVPKNPNSVPDIEIDGEGAEVAAEAAMVRSVVGIEDWSDIFAA